MNNTDNRKKSIYSKNIYLSSVCATIGTMCVHDIGWDDDALSLWKDTALTTDEEDDRKGRNRTKGRLSSESISRTHANWKFYYIEREKGREKILISCPEMCCSTAPGEKWREKLNQIFVRKMLSTEKRRGGRVSWVIEQKGCYDPSDEERSKWKVLLNQQRRDKQVNKWHQNKIRRKFVFDLSWASCYFSLENFQRTTNPLHQPHF